MYNWLLLYVWFLGLNWFWKFWFSGLIWFRDLWISFSSNEFRMIELWPKWKWLMLKKYFGERFTILLTILSWLRFNMLLRWTFVNTYENCQRYFWINLCDFDRKLYLDSKIKIVYRRCDNWSIGCLPSKYVITINNRTPTCDVRNLTIFLSVNVYRTSPL